MKRFSLNIFIAKKKSKGPDHSGKSATIRESNHGLGVCEEHTIYQKAPFC